MTSREEFLKRLRNTFCIEASEGIEHITSGLIELEKGASVQREHELIETIFRDAHSLKGAARAVNFSNIELICQSLENVFSELKAQALKLTPELFDLFHQTIDLMGSLLQNPSETTDEVTSKKVSALIPLLKNAATQSEKSYRTEKANEISFGSEPFKRSINQATSQETTDAHLSEAEQEIPNIPQQSFKSENTIRISIEKLDDLLNQAEEMLTIKQSLAHITGSLLQIRRKLDVLDNETLQVTSALHEAIRESNPSNAIQVTTGYFDWAVSSVKSIGTDLELLCKQAYNKSHDSGIKIESLLDEVKKIISVPFSLLLDGYPKAVRDLSKDEKKKVKIEVRGSEHEIDRRILEDLRIPFIHLLRNTIDHGIERPDVRIQKGKSETAVINITVERMENNRILITFSDDGAGIDIDKVKQKYIRQENIPEKEWPSISESTLLNHIFKSGFSTSEIITDISGRGLGLSIVKEKVEQLGGTVFIETVQGEGTTFKIEVPLSLVTFRGVIIRSGESEFVIPTSKIGKVLHVYKKDMRTVENKQTFIFDGVTIPLTFLSNILGTTLKETESDKWIVMLLGLENERIGFVIDAIIDEETILLKKFNNQMKRVRNISGATVLGSGKVIPILNVADLLRSAAKSSTINNGEQKTEKKKNTILVVEDSITSRMLLKNILETAGYKVDTAFDGIDGYTRLKESKADIVISDVDMPRMNGFDMTSKIRSDKALSEIPVVLVTSLSKREDRERGLEVGANAYIVKSNFDQGNLLEVIDRLLE
jgi:two-component system, chemotaxis family, sensor kinase CheA